MKTGTYVATYRCGADDKEEISEVSVNRTEFRHLLIQNLSYHFGIFIYRCNGNEKKN